MKSLLAIISAPFKNANIVQAMAIQAQQPDIIVQIRTKIFGQSELILNNNLIAEWLKGSGPLIQAFGDLNEPYNIPFTPPTGYISKDSKQPELIEIDADSDNLLAALLQIENDYPNHEYIIDLLPGAKLAKFDAFLEGARNWKKTYTLEDGVVLNFDSSCLESKHGKFLSIIDRCWLSGFPVHVSADSESIRQNEEFYSMVTDSIYIEPFNQKEQNYINSRKKKPVGMSQRIKDRPISISSGKFVARFEERGGRVIRKWNNGINLEGLKGETWNIEFFQNTVPNGVPLELLMVNEINKNWNMTELFHGISIIQPTAELRVTSYMNLLRKQHDSFSANPELEHEIGPFRDRCELLGLSTNSPLEEIMEFEFKYLEKFDEEGKKLAYIRICEIDALGLDSHGISSFDAKQILRKVNLTQARMQRPSFLFNPESNHHYVISSTTPDSKLSEHSVIHLSNLKNGRKVLPMHEKSKWNPSEHDLKQLREDWDSTVLEVLQVQANHKIFQPKLLTELYFETKIGISWDVMSELLWGEKIEPIDAIINYCELDHKAKDNFIQTFQRRHLFICEQFQTSLQKKSMEITHLRQQTLASENRRAKLQKKLQQFEKKFKESNEKKTIDNATLKTMLEEIHNSGTDYKVFCQSLREEGYLTKGIFKKINLIAKKELGYVFELSGKEKNLLRPVKKNHEEE